jgi:outer membrane lipoprotein carrier protein
MKYYFLFAVLFIFNVNVKAEANAPSHDATLVQPGTQTLSTAKKALMKKLANLIAFKANFEQQIFNEEGQLLQTNQGNLAVSKPNLLYWHIKTPDESLIVSDGKTLWFYDPFIEQVSLYAIDKAINNTPVLLLVSPEPNIWQNYHVKQLSENHFSIMSKDENSQVKSLTLVFTENRLTNFEILDATGQISRITLTHTKELTADDKHLFQFTPAQGVEIDDQR